MKRLGLTALLFAAPSTAMAFQLSGYMWDTDDLPLSFVMSDYLEDSLPQNPDANTGLYYQEQSMIRSYCNWHWTPECDALLPDDPVVDAAPCAEISYSYGGMVPGHEGPTNDGINKIYFDDPSDDAGAGVNGFMRPRTANVLIKEIAGEFIYKLVDADIVFNDNIDWGTTEDIEAGCGGGEMALESTGTHEVGHLWGMGHSCEQDEVCSNDAFLSATMFWTGGPCDTSRSEINNDDVDGITAIYGPFATFSTQSPRFGPAPLEVCFDLVTEDVITAASWNFGDGERSEELEPCHTYEEQGQYTVTANLTGDSETCGEWDFDYRELAYVLVCEVPAPEFFAEAAENTAGFVYQMINSTDVTTYGCIDEINWSVYDKKDGELLQSIGAWSPKINFDGEGDYWVELTVGGPAGSSTAGLKVTVEEQTLGGCVSTGSRAGGFAGMLLVFGLLLRRRRS